MLYRADEELRVGECFKIFGFETFLNKQHRISVKDK
jgi:hypothetical protein